jgi:hypothetical protein
MHQKQSAFDVKTEEDANYRKAVQKRSRAVLLILQFHLAVKIIGSSQPGHFL